MDLFTFIKEILNRVIHSSIVETKRRKYSENFG